MYVNVLLPKSCCRGGCGLGPAHCISLLCLLWLLRLLWFWLWLLLPSLPSLGGLLHTYQFACCSPSLFWFGSVFADRFCNHEWRQSLKQLSTCWQVWGKSYQKASNISQYPVIFWTWICCHVADVNIFPLGRLFLLGDFEPSPVAVEAVLESSKSRTCAAEQNVTQGLCIFCHLRRKTLFTLSPPQKSARNQQC